MEFGVSCFLFISVDGWIYHFHVICIFHGETVPKTLIIEILTSEFQNERRKLLVGSTMRRSALKIVQAW